MFALGSVPLWPFVFGAAMIVAVLGVVVVSRTRKSK